MKRIFFVMVVMTILGTTNVNAQDFKFGAKAGINLANLRNNGETTDSRPSIHFGLVAEYKLSEQFTVQPELLYSGQGAKGKSYVDELDITLKFDYLNLPIMFKYYVTSTDFGFNFGLGFKVNKNLFFDARYNLGLSDISDEDLDIHNGTFQISVGYMF